LTPQLFFVKFLTGCQNINLRAEKTGCATTKQRAPAMDKNRFVNLSRRERQIMDAVYKLGEATAAEIMNAIPSPPTYAAVRRLIAILEEKGHLTHYSDGPRYVYRPTVDKEKAGKTAIAHLTQTFFQDSAARTVAAMLDSSVSELTDEELDELSELIEKAKGEGR
jgi:predicted transcriptional regulator